jgi:hypothetical protein
MKEELDYYWSLGELPDTQAGICLIHKVQQHIREVSRFSYEPIMLSIGPYHHGAVSCQAIEKTKWGYLSEVVRINCKRNLLDYLNAVGALVSQARSCYSEQIKMNNESFLQMLLLDGCTILVALGGTVELRAQIESSDVSSDMDEITADGEKEKLKQKKEERTNTEHETRSQESEQNRDMEDKEPEQSGLWFIRFVNHDLLLLENQIPFFIVKKLYELVAGKNAPSEPFTAAIAKYVESALRCYPIAIKDFDRPHDFQHLLHLCHMYFRPSQKPAEEQHYEIGPQYFHSFLSFGRKYLKLGQDHHYLDRNGHSTQHVEYLEAGQQLNRWRRAAQYLEAGVQFRKRDFDKLDPHSLLDVRFTSSALEVPCVVIDEHTELLFRNLIAFEQTCPQFGDDFTAYSIFMSQLISMPEDVTLLAKKGILVHHLDSDETVSDLFTMLSQDVVFDFNGNYYLKSLCQTMEAHYQNRLNRWIAWLWFNHFSNPWLGLAALATVVVLVCTILQTVYGILAYVHPPGSPNP